MESVTNIVRWVRRGVLALGLLLAFSALIEVLRAYQVLRGFHPVLGWGFALFVLGCVVALCGWVAALRRRYPVVPLAPPVHDLEEADEDDVVRYGRYLTALLGRLRDNPLLDETQRALAASHEEELRRELRSGTMPHVQRLTRECAHAVLPAMFAPLDDAAERHVRQAVRDVTVGVAVSPWHSVDLIVVLYRNVRMVADVLKTYTTRPGLREEFLVLRDVATVVATVNFLNYGSRLFQSLGANIPFLGRFADDIAQGIGAGLMTSVAGHAAIDRCRSFEGWEREEARARMVGRLGEFLGDLRQIATTDLAASFRERLRPRGGGPLSGAEQGGAPVSSDRMREGLGRAMDETTRAMDQFVRRPVVAVGRGVAGTGHVVGRSAKSGVRRVFTTVAGLFRRSGG